MSRREPPRRTRRAAPSGAAPSGPTLPGLTRPAAGGVAAAVADPLDWRATAVALWGGLGPALARALWRWLTHA